MSRSRRPSTGSWCGSLDRELLRELAIERFGIDVPPLRRGAVPSRLRARLDARGLSTFGAYYRLLRESPDGVEEWGHFADAMTCDETRLFGGVEQLEAVAALLPALGRRGRPLRVLSAGCATGEEAFSVGAVLAAHAAALPDGFQVIGVDISTPRLAAACVGICAAPPPERLPAGVDLDACFVRDGERLRVREPLRRLVTFHVGNLAGAGLALGRFDVILCRNVLVDAHDEGWPRIVRTLAASLEPEGHLFLGEAEALSGRATPFTPRPVGGQHAYVWAA